MKTRTIIAALFIATMQADAITIDLGPPSTLYHGAKLFDPDISVQFPKPITFLQGQSLSFDIVFAHQGLTEFLQIPAAPRDTTAIVGLFCALQVSGVGLFQMPLSNTYTFDASGVRNSPIQSFGGSVLNDDPGRIFSYSIGTVFPINPSDPVVYPFNIYGIHVDIPALPIEPDLTIHGASFGIAVYDRNFFVGPNIPDTGSTLALALIGFSLVVLRKQTTNERNQ